MDSQCVTEWRSSSYCCRLAKSFAAKPHYTITGQVVAIADGDTLTVLDDIEDAAQDSACRHRRAREGPGFRHKSARESRRKGLPQDRPRRRDRCRPLPPRSRPHLSWRRFINMEMVRDGFAWRYVAIRQAGRIHGGRRRCPEHRRGLWADPNPMPPWEWRKAKRRSSSEQR